MEITRGSGYFGPRQAGHGGGDFWTNFHFANAVRSGQPPPSILGHVEPTEGGIRLAKEVWAETGYKGE